MFLYVVWRTCLGGGAAPLSLLSLSSSRTEHAPVWERDSALDYYNDGGGGAEVTYRIYESRTMWNAMVAHQSQFVWYCRLLVLFNRYTYENTLLTINIVGNGDGIGGAGGKECNSMTALWIYTYAINHHKQYAMQHNHNGTNLPAS